MELCKTTPSPSPFDIVPFQYYVQNPALSCIRKPMGRETVRRLILAFAVILIKMLFSDCPVYSIDSDLVFRSRSATTSRT
ncbi:hypothetical protein BDW69DRAFT_129559 [Aspergillus filifer]